MLMHSQALYQSVMFVNVEVTSDLAQRYGLRLLLQCCQILGEPRKAGPPFPGHMPSCVEAKATSRSSLGSSAAAY
jgi:hypothetical protein